jgi:regulatory protein
MPAPRARLSLKARAIQWLSQREHSRLELERKMHAQLAKEARAAARWHDATKATETAALPAPDVDALLNELEQLGLLSDARFAESRVRTRAAKLGTSRIRAELSQHGVSLDANAIKNLRDSEHSRAQQLWQRRFGGERAATAPERARQMRFLSARGFSTDVVVRVVEGRLNPGDNA